ncbi:MAG TPA: tRNA lysidine(34) synthetase TilS [Burkholderiales bacterium]|nr:tRNA lysidine(34) synthetase TilS [Burkholderiales bacterium]
MASSRKPKRSSARKSLVSHVAAALTGVVLPGQRLVLGLSGGIDSIVLLDVLVRLAPRMGFCLEAFHVNHQLSPNAAAWARFCRAACRRLSVRCKVVKVEVQRGNSIEAAARAERYAALMTSGADHIALAHNLDDQAETIVLQLLRGAGVKGLAAMPAVRTGAGRTPSIVRPLLNVPRGEIERYARRRKLEWIEDESNADTHYARNWLRSEVVPRIAQRVPAYRETLARAARNLGEAAGLLDELAAIDAATVRSGDGLSVDAMRALSPARAKNLLRFLLNMGGWRMPESARLTEALRQALGARRGARVVVDLGSCELRLHRGVIHLVPSRLSSVDDAVVTWRGERELALPTGVLTMTRGRGAGLSAAKLQRAAVTIRCRRGGERLQPDPRRPRRTVKNLLQEAGIPPWQRERLPFIYCGDTLACVPGAGVDYRFRAGSGEPSIAASWREL